MRAMQREHQAAQADAQQNLGVHLARAYAPGAFDMITRHPRHGTNAVDPFEGSEVQRMLEGGCANCDTILADAGLTVHGAGYLSYPGEGLVKDGWWRMRCNTAVTMDAIATTKNQVQCILNCTHVCPD